MTKRPTTNLPSKGEKFVGLDLSLNGTGVAIVRRSPSGEWTPPELVLLANRPPSPVTAQYHVERLADIAARIESAGALDNTTLLCIEDYAMGISTEHTNCVFQLGELGGVVRFLLVTNHIPFILVPIGTNKKFATGNGAAKKPQVAEGMSRLWSIPNDFKTHDLSDALSLASVAAFVHYGDLPGLTVRKSQVAALRDLEVLCKRK